MWNWRSNGCYGLAGALFVVTTFTCSPGRSPSRERRNSRAKWTNRCKYSTRLSLPFPWHPLRGPLRMRRFFANSGNSASRGSCSGVSDHHPLQASVCGLAWLPDRRVLTGLGGERVHGSLRQNPAGSAEGTRADRHRRRALHGRRWTYPRLAQTAVSELFGSAFRSRTTYA